MTQPRRRRRKARLLLTALAFYTVAYVVLSSAGGYVETASGNVRMSYGFSIPDRYEWQPRYGTFSIKRNLSGKRIIDGDPLGLLLAPLIVLDQTLFHPDLPFRDPQTGKLLPDPLLPTDVALHPRYGRR